MPFTKFHFLISDSEEGERIKDEKAVYEEIDKACLEMKQYDDFCLGKIAEIRKYKGKKHHMFTHLNRPANLGL